MRRNSTKADGHVPPPSAEDTELETVDTALPMDVVRLEWTGGMTVRSLELRAGFTPGRLANWLKPGQRGKSFPTPYALRSFAEAYRCPVNVVGRAFAEEAGIPELYGAGDPPAPQPPAPDPYTPEERQMIEDLRRTREPVRSLLIAQVHLAAERKDCREGTA